MLYQYQRYTTPEGLSFIQVAISFSFSVGVSQFPFFNICLPQVLGIKEVLTREDGTATWGVDIKVGFAKPSMLEV